MTMTEIGRTPASASGPIPKRKAKDYFVPPIVIPPLLTLAALIYALVRGAA